MFYKIWKFQLYWFLKSLQTKNVVQNLKITIKYQEGTTGILSAFQFFEPLIQSKVSYELNIMFSFPGKTDQHG
jgi:hypothetical protein